jgi:hypothetical protein
MWNMCPIKHNTMNTHGVEGFFEIWALHCVQCPLSKGLKRPKCETDHTHEFSVTVETMVITWRLHARPPDAFTTRRFRVRTLQLCTTVRKCRRLTSFVKDGVRNEKTSFRDSTRARNIIRDCHCPGSDLNPVPPDHDEVLSFTPQLKLN